MNLDAIEKDYYLVMVDEIKVSQHTKPLKAIARAQEEKAKNKDAYIYVKQPNIEPVVEITESAIVEELLAEIEQLKEEYDMLWAEFERYKTLNGGTAVEPPIETLKAFPSAIGAGAYATGGRGGKVCHVNTLTWNTAVVYDAGTDSYSGGFYNMFYELDIPAKQIVFDVAGIIVVPTNNVLNFANKTNSGNITISGQTAPGKIVFSSGLWVIENCSNLIVRYIDFYKRADDGVGADTLWVVANDAPNVIENIIFDHCSFFYGQDECLSIANSDTGLLDKVTVQNTLMAASSKGSIIGSYNGICDATTAYCAYVDISYRFPNMLGMGESRQDAINNFVENYTTRMIRTTGSGNFNVQNNYYQSNRSGLIGQYLQYQTLYGDPTLHSSGAIITDGIKETPTTPDFDLWRIFAASDLPENDPIPVGFKKDLPFDLVGQPFKIYPTAQIKTNVLPNIGNIKRIDENGAVVNDSYDLTSYYIDRAINQVPTADQQNYPVERYPSVVQKTPYVSTLKDGISDTWRATNLSGQAGSDLDAVGYSYLERFLNQVDSDYIPYEPVYVESVSISPISATVGIGGTQQLEAVFNPIDPTIPTGSWSSSNEALATVSSSGLVTTLAEGSVTITFTATDTTNGILTGTSDITVFASANYYTALNAANPENDTDAITGWTKNNSDTAINSISNGDGTFSIQCIATAGLVSPTLVRYYVSVPLTEAGTYEITFKAQEIGGSDGRLSQIRNSNGSGTYVSYTIPSFTSTRAEYTVTLTNVDGTTIQLEYFCYNAVDGHEIQIDDISLIKL